MRALRLRISAYAKGVFLDQMELAMVCFARYEYAPAAVHINVAFIALMLALAFGLTSEEGAHG